MGNRWEASGCSGEEGPRVAEFTAGSGQIHLGRIDERMRPSPHEQFPHKAFFDTSISTSTSSALRHLSQGPERPCDVHEDEGDDAGSDQWAVFRL